MRVSDEIHTPRVGFVVLCLAAALAVAPVAAIDCYTPREWQGKLQSPVMDADGDFVQDTIDLAGSDPIGVVVDLRACAQPADLVRLAGFGRIAARGSYLSYLVLADVMPATIPDLASDPIVAFVEANTPMTLMLDVSREVVGAGDVESTYGLLGSGVTIAVVDTGVDDGVHDALPSTAYVGGLDCNGCGCSDSGGFCESDADCPGSETCGCTCTLTGETCLTTADCLNPPPPLPPVNQCLSEPVCTLRNPDDTSGHGTLVASIALGRGGGDCPGCRGVAAGAGLVDVKVFDATRGASKGSVLHALGELIKHREALGVRIANLSLGSCDPSDGTDALAQKVNRMAFEGILPVVAVGNYPSCGYLTPPFPSIVPTPASADDALSVGWLEDMGTVATGDDVISPGSFTGPRPDDMDFDSDDELKPDLAAPGQAIAAAVYDTSGTYVESDGTSMAAPHVAGCAALVLEADPTMLPLSVKELLVDTAADEGPAGWDPAWGHGRVDCFAAVDDKATTVGTDLGFEVYYCRESGSPPCWSSPEIVPADDFIVEGVPNSVVATVTNFGAIAAPPFDVKLGVFNFGNPDESYHICTKEVPGLDPGLSTSVACDWIPAASGPPPGAIHACLKAEVIYPFDTDFENQRAQRNVLIRQAFSPAVFHALIANPALVPRDMQLVPQFACECPPPGSGMFQCPCAGWVFETDEPVIPLGPDDCPVTTELRLEPVDPALATRRAAVDVEVIGIDPGNGAMEPAGGVTITTELACQTDSLIWIDSNTFVWQPPIYQVCPDLYDVARGPLPIVVLPDRAGGNFQTANCLSNDQPQTNFFEPVDPPPGQGFYYLTTTDDPGNPPPGSWNGGTQFGTRDRSLQACRPPGP